MANPAIDPIVQAYCNGLLTIEQANEKLAAVGANFHFSDEKWKGANGYVNVYVGGPEPAFIEDGKIIKPTGYGPQYTVHYNGEVWHTVSYDDQTLVKGYPEV